MRQLQPSTPTKPNTPFTLATNTTRTITAIIPIITTVTTLLTSCSKHKQNIPPPTPIEKKILLKEINDRTQPSPYYHFEYDKDSLISRASFESGLADYEVLQKNNKIAEMRDMIIVNKDTLRYLYDNQGKLAMISIIDDDTHVVIRHFIFTFDGSQLKKIERDRKEQSGFFIDNVEQFTYYPDGNLQTKIRLIRTSSQEFTDTTRYEQYDDKINVDDFDIVNGSINEHLFLFQGFRLQKNNPGKVTFTQPSGLNNMVTAFTYTYNPDNTPSKKTGDIFVTGTGAGSGSHIPYERTYTYYTN